MEGFIKTESSEPAAPKLSGFQKIAVLLSEIGFEAGQKVLSHINFSDSQIIKLNSAFRSLGEFNPHNEFQVRRENAVLNEAASFGKKRGIYSEISIHTQSQKKTDDFASKNPKEIAKFLSGLLSKD